MENRVSIHDLHATMLYNLGIDHTKLTYRYVGHDFRLTDVYGGVVKNLLVLWVKPGILWRSTRCRARSGPRGSSPVLFSVDAVLRSHKIR